MDGIDSGSLASAIARDAERAESEKPVHTDDSHVSMNWGRRPEVVKRKKYTKRTPYHLDAEYAAHEAAKPAGGHVMPSPDGGCSVEIPDRGYSYGGNYSVRVDSTGIEYNVPYGEKVGRDAEIIGSISSWLRKNGITAEMEVGKDEEHR